MLLYIGRESVVYALSPQVFWIQKLLGAAALSILLLLQPGVGCGEEGKSWNQIHEETIELLKRGKFLQASKTAEKGLQIAESVYGSEHLNVAIALHELGRAYHWLGRNREAGLLYSRALAIREKTLGRDHPDVASVLINMGALYSETGKYDQAEGAYTRVVAMGSILSGTMDLHVADALTSLGGLYALQRREKEAEDSYRQAIGMLENARGIVAPELARALANYGAFCQMRERLQEAEQLYLRALRIVENTEGGPEDLFPGVILGALGDVYAAQGKYGEAESFLKQSIEISEKFFGSEDPGVGITLQRYAKVLRKLQREEEAKTVEARANRILSKLDLSSPRGQ